MGSRISIPFRIPPGAASASLSGLLLFLSFPKFGSGLLAWVSLVPLFVSLRDRTEKEAFRLGWLGGLVGHLGIMYWIATVVVTYGYLPPAVGVGAVFLLSLYLSLYTAFFAWGCAWSTRRGVPLAAAAPPLWVLGEFVKSKVLTGFPWENLGCSQYLYPPLIQIVEYTGVYGLSFIVVLVNALLFAALVSGATRVGRALAYLGAVSFLLASLTVFGLWRMETVQEAVRKAPEREMSLIQGNVDQSVKWDPRYQQATMATYTGLTRAHAPRPGGVIVWPETAVPSFFQDVDDIHRAMIALARETGAWLLFGSPSYKEEENRRTLYNSTYLLRPDGSLAARYDKVHLVPFGEYVPLRRLFPFMGKMVPGVGDFGTGPDYRPLDMDGVAVGVLICYEGIFPEAARRYRQNGAEILVNITNDAWFGETSAPYQHLSMTVFRAVENRLFLARGANTGITAIIDPLGRITARTGLFRTEALKGRVKLMKSETFYVKHGDVFAFVCIALSVIGAIYAWKRSRGHD
ncbi:MAG TPA: apolipoprotein N-acyltransferase [Syntrophales bacterium]|nr:apolipoprotein N-acyltransferase [Syntrophales bacterium]HPC01921.1 apolipoprotein N-acyltransferase [Syntrophales bacterium]HRS87120.1 apolipoprotein N-acyltransferase [Syntrophales bacterium]HRV42769.1 apolipoprotein N-acyltransferase [Syntrophales bacterium]